MMCRGNILITGGAGYIGQHIVINILKNGYRCIIIDNLCTSHNFNKSSLINLSGVTDLDMLHFYQKDIRDLEGLETIIKLHRATLGYIIHLAALKSIPESIQNPELYYDVNVNGTENLIKLAVKYHIPKFVFSSTAAVYAGPPDSTGYKESDALEIDKLAHPYAKTKRKCELLLQDYSNNNKELQIVALRYFNPIGNIREGTIGERMLMGNSTGLMFQLGSTYLGKNKKFKLYGTDYLESSDGTAMRDFINVEDLAESHLAIINKIKNNGYYCYNVGTGKPISVKKLVDTFKGMTDKQVPIIEVDRRIGDQSVVYADTTLLTRDIDWKCSRTLDVSCNSFLNRCRYLEGILKI